MVYVDNYNFPKGGRTYCHMVASTVEELNDMALQIGLKVANKHNNHYDVTKNKKILAIRYGAIEVDAKVGAALAQRMAVMGTMGDPSDALAWARERARVRAKSPSLAAVSLPEIGEVKNET